MPPRPVFDGAERGLDPDQVHAHLDALLRWGQRQARRADSAEQILAEAVDQLRDQPHSPLSPEPPTEIR